MAELKTEQKDLPWWALIPALVGGLVVSRGKIGPLARMASTGARSLARLTEKEVSAKELYRPFAMGLARLTERTPEAALKPIKGLSINSKLIHSLGFYSPQTQKITLGLPALRREMSAIEKPKLRARRIEQWLEKLYPEVYSHQGYLVGTGRPESVPVLTHELAHARQMPAPTAFLTQQFWKFPVRVKPLLELFSEVHGMLQEPISKDTKTFLANVLKAKLREPPPVPSPAGQADASVYISEVLVRQKLLKLLKEDFPEFAK